MDMGLDSFTGIVTVIKDKLNWDYKKAKILFDIIMVIIGTVLGGKLGVITLAAALIAGPMIQLIANKTKYILNMI